MILDTKQNPSGSYNENFKDCTCAPGNLIPVYCDWCIKTGWRWKDKSKDQLIDIIIEMSNRIHEKQKDVKYYYIPAINLNGDCMPQCLNCIRLGKEYGYNCKCENPLWSMDSSAIRREGGKV